jgi:hypothetical protein
MSRLLFATVFWALGIAQALAQSEMTQRLLELEDDERNAAFTLILRDSSRKCDQVIRTLFNGTVLGVDEWEAMCRDQNAYSLSVLAQRNETIINAVSCRDLLATKCCCGARAARTKRTVAGSSEQDEPHDEPSQTDQSAYQSGAE